MGSRHCAAEFKGARPCCYEGEIVEASSLSSETIPHIGNTQGLYDVMIRARANIASVLSRRSIYSRT